MSRLPNRIRELREAAGLSQEALAQMVGTSNQQIGRLERGERELTLRWMERIATSLQCKPADLLPSAGTDDSRGHAPSSESNVEPVQGELRWVPLISWVEAGWGAEAISHLAPNDVEEWFPCPARCSPQTYALRVRGDSMLPDYREGEIVFVDPNLEPRHRDEVVVCNEQNGEATMKQLLIEGDRRYLKALNRDYPERIRLMTEEDSLCGVVIGLYRERR